jgi:putative tricarboxylic transport membrane protein
MCQNGGRYGLEEEAMHIKNGKDFWAGLMFAGAGLSFMLVSQNYPMGSAVRMGPAYFPTALGGLLAVLGAMVFFRAFVSKIEHPLKVIPFRLPLLIASIVIGIATYLASGGVLFFGAWAMSFGDNLFKNAPMVQFALTGLSLFLFFGAFGPRAMFVILRAVVIFGYALKPLGLVLAIVLLIVLSAVGGHDFRNKEIAILTVLLVLFGVLVFVKGLGLPFNLWPGE